MRNEAKIYELNKNVKLISGAFIFMLNNENRIRNLSECF